MGGQKAPAGPCHPIASSASSALHPVRAARFCILTLDSERRQRLPPRQHGETEA